MALQDSLQGAHDATHRSQSSTLKTYSSKKRRRKEYPDPVDKRQRLDDPTLEFVVHSSRVNFSVVEPIHSKSKIEHYFSTTSQSSIQSSTSTLLSDTLSSDAVSSTNTSPPSSPPQDYLLVQQRQRRRLTIKPQIKQHHTHTSTDIMFESDSHQSGRDDEEDPNRKHPKSKDQLPSTPYTRLSAKLKQMTSDPGQNQPTEDHLTLVLSDDSLNSSLEALDSVPGALNIPNPRLAPTLATPIPTGRPGHTPGREPTIVTHMRARYEEQRRVGGARRHVAGGLPVTIHPPVVGATPVTIRPPVVITAPAANTFLAAGAIPVGPATSVGPAAAAAHTIPAARPIPIGDTFLRVPAIAVNVSTSRQNLVQSTLAGISNIVTCKACDMSYDRTLPTERSKHDEHHANVIHGLAISSMGLHLHQITVMDRAVPMNVDIISAAANQVVLITSTSHISWKRFAEQVLKDYVNPALGMVDIPADILWSIIPDPNRSAIVGNVKRFSVILSLVSGKKTSYRAVGAVLVERIGKAHEVTTEQAQPDESGDWFPEVSQFLTCRRNMLVDEAVFLGIHSIWVHCDHRLQGHARRMVDGARQHVIYGKLVGRNEVAFSRTTDLGEKFAKAYTKSTGFELGGERLLYREYDC